MEPGVADVLPGQLARFAAQAQELHDLHAAMRRLEHGKDATITHLQCTIADLRTDLAEREAEIEELRKRADLADTTAARLRETETLFRLNEARHRRAVCWMKWKQRFQQRRERTERRDMAQMAFHWWTVDDAIACVACAERKFSSMRSALLQSATDSFNVQQWLTAAVGMLEAADDVAAARFQLLISIARCSGLATRGAAATAGGGLGGGHSNLHSQTSVAWGSSGSSIYPPTLDPSSRSASSSWSSFPDPEVMRIEMNRVRSIGAMTAMLPPLLSAFHAAASSTSSSSSQQDYAAFSATLPTAAAAPPPHPSSAYFPHSRKAESIDAKRNPDLLLHHCAYMLEEALQQQAGAVTGWGLPSTGGSESQRTRMDALSRLASKSPQPVVNGAATNAMTPRGPNAVSGRASAR